MIKKNQVIIFAVAVMLIAAGYLNYKIGENGNTVETSNSPDTTEIAGLGDAKLVNGQVLSNEDDEYVGQNSRTCKQ